MRKDRPSGMCLRDGLFYKERRAAGLCPRPFDDAAKRKLAGTRCACRLLHIKSGGDQGFRVSAHAL